MSAEKVKSRPVADRITVGLIPRVAMELDNITAVTGMSKTDLINRSISLYKFIKDRLDEGWDLALVKDSPGGRNSTIERIHLL